MSRLNNPEAKWACAILAFVLAIGTALAQYTPPSGGSGGTNYWTATGNDIFNNNTGNVGIGGTPVSSGPYVGKLSLFGNDLIQTISANLFAYRFIGEKRGTDGDAMGAVTAGTELSGFTAVGWNGSAYPSSSAGGFVIATVEDWTTMANGTRLKFYTTPIGTVAAGDNTMTLLESGNLGLQSTAVYGLSSSLSDPAAIDTGLSRLSAGRIAIGNGVANDFSGSLKLTNLSGASYSTNTVCASAATPAACGASAAGSVAIPTGVTTVTLVVGTTAVTASSQIILTPDDSITIPMTTCNSTLATLVGGMAVTARTAGTSFTITYNGTIAANPLCVSYQIIN